nr:MAG TPA: hypothetical protein [Caudoviricetes sp.]DAK65421.1 MAG TPA: hypothetical protein [Caudoviricetes sp.]
MEKVSSVIQVTQSFFRLFGKVFRPVHRYCGGSVCSVQVLFVDCVQVFHVFPRFHVLFLCGCSHLVCIYITLKAHNSELYIENLCIFLRSLMRKEG